jgi:hypothetical protein
MYKNINRAIVLIGATLAMTVNATNKSNKNAVFNT